MSTELLSYPELENLSFRDEDTVLKISKREIEAMADSEIERIAKKHGSVEDAPEGYELCPDDIAMIRAVSDNPKYNKPMIPLTVGKGIYNIELEEAIIGMKEKETRTVILEEGEVQVTVLKIKTKTVPSISWDLIKDDLGDGYESISSIDELRRSLIDEAMEMYKYDSFYGRAASYMRDLIVEKCDYELDMKEFSDYRDRIINSIKKGASEEGMTTLEYMCTLFGGSEEIGTDNVEKRVEYNIKNDYLFLVYAKKIAEKNNIQVSHSEYEKFVEDYCQEMGVTKDEVEREFSFEMYSLQYIESMVQNMIIEKYMSVLKV